MLTAYQGRNCVYKSQIFRDHSPPCALPANPYARDIRQQDTGKYLACQHVVYSLLEPELVFPCWMFTTFSPSSLSCLFSDVLILSLQTSLPFALVFLALYPLVLFSLSWLPSQFSPSGFSYMWLFPVSPFTPLPVSFFYLIISHQPCKPQQQALRKELLCCTLQKQATCSDTLTQSAISENEEQEYAN